jgi:DNA/RNA-binding domain of Phe-tRNA-synthetase-like protein
VSEPEVEAGWVDDALARELPGLALSSVGARAAASGRVSGGLRRRLRLLSDRFGGARAVGLRREPVPAAYRAFFRQVGLDPDVERPPAEAVVLDRLLHGGFRSTDRLADALLVAVVETGVPVYALDEARLSGPLGLRPARPAERIGDGEAAAEPAPGSIVVADAERPVAALFAPPAASYAAGVHTESVRLYAVAVEGVPAIHVEEALFMVADALAEG